LSFGYYFSSQSCPRPDGVVDSPELHQVLVD
jgi:hypothetical protein